MVDNQNAAIGSRAALTPGAMPRLSTLTEKILEELAVPQ